MSPLKVQGWHLLRRSGLTKDQRQMVMLKAPQLEKKEVIEALYLIFGQDQKGVNTERPRHHYRGKGGKGRGYYVDEEAGYFQDENDEVYYEHDDDTGYYEDSEWTAEQYGDWQEDENVDHDAIYYQEEEPGGEPLDTPFPVDTYDEVYAAYVDARKRFSDLRLSRGFLPAVALSDPSAGNLSPGLSSPGGSPGHGKGKKGGKGKGTGGKEKNLYKYNKPPPKPAETRMRGKALTCLRCGKPGHFAAECPVKSSMATSSRSTKRSASTLEAMAKFEDAHVTFVDSTGQERPDVTLLDPGASAFLCGYGPLARYLNYLKIHGYPVEKIEFNRCCRRFQFGGDGSSWSHWVVRLPLCISGVLGQAQVFLVKGETPLLCGRPEALGIDLAFSRQAIRYRDGPWMPATLGLHGGIPCGNHMRIWTSRTWTFSSTSLWLLMVKLIPILARCNSLSKKNKLWRPLRLPPTTALRNLVIDLYLQSNFRPSTPFSRRCTMTSMPTSPKSFDLGGVLRQCQDF